jgi:hypothetical protein
MKPDDGTLNTNYGVHGCELRFVLKGPRGAVQFLVYTNWQLSHVAVVNERHNHDHLLCKPMGADVGYHSPVPTYDGQTSIRSACPYLDGKPCYYDGSGLRAEIWLNEILLPLGSDGVWKALEQEYHERFEPERTP